jgi:DNA-binding transcriptional MocR family regulator
MTRTRCLEILGDWSRGAGPLYQRLASALRAAIERGDLPAATRLPAQRRLAAWLELSRTTVVMAYDVLVQESWLETREGSGTRVCRSSARGLTPRGGAAAILSAHNVVFRGLVEKSGAEIEFHGAHFNGIPRRFDRVLGEAGDELRQVARGHGYLPLGLPALRRAVAAHLERAGLPTREEQVLITSGAQQAIALLAGLLVEPGDAVILEDPTYLGAIDAFASFGARLAGVPVDGDGVRADALRDTIARMSPRIVYLVPTCHNPTGAVLPAEARREIAGIVGSSGVVLIEDLTLADLTLAGTAPPPIAAFAPSATTLTVGSLSKLFWGGLRVGWIRGPEPVIARLARLKVVSDLSGSMISQAVAVRVLARARELAALRRRQIQTGLLLAERLMAKCLPSWSFRRPAGGLSLWVRLPAGDAVELAALALRHGVSIVPGNVNSPEGRFPDHLRLPYVDEPRRVEEGIGRLAEAWADYAPDRRGSRRGVGVLV